MLIRCHSVIVLQVINEHRDIVHSTEYAALHMTKKQLRNCKLSYRYDDAQLRTILRKVKERLVGTSAAECKKKGPRLKKASHPM